MPEGPYIGPYVKCVRHHSVRKWKDIMRFEIRYFFLEIGLSPKGLTQFQEKKDIILNLAICFRFPRACVRNYTMRALLYR